MKTPIPTVCSFVLCSAAAWAVAGAPAMAEDNSEAVTKSYKEVEDAFGKVPDFVKAFPKNAFPGAWKEIKAIEFADGALTVKEKSLIALAVAAQIPCHYCVWADTFTARKSGATEDQIKEAVAVSALERHWSTVFNGMQVDFQQFKKDYGGE
jgi:AhpD family alkylhydroperoxidase